MGTRAWVCACLCLAACGGGTTTDAGVDAPSDAGAGVDVGPDAPPDMTCATDADSDGHVAMSCGGDDCDDTDPNRYPTNPEVCDAAGHDEDCDPATLGPDHDGDGFPAVTCCDTQPGGALLCGTDCDDTTRDVSPTAPEVCDGIDDDCDGMIDEGVSTTYAPDCDDDGYGATAGTMTGCTAPTTAPPCGAGVHYWSTVGGDCNDGDAAVNPGATEICNGVDDDCDAMTDPEPAASASCSVHGVSSCVAGACTIPTCPTAFLDCDPTAVGCETDSRTDPMNCGGCGIVCGSPTCAGGVCTHDFTFLAAGNDFTCGVRRAGTVACWGENNHGQLGDGTRTDSYQPVSVTGITDALTIVAGAMHVCAKRSGGVVSCWGGNGQGQLGDGTTTDRGAPVDVVGLTDAVGLAAGTFHTCARVTGGGVKCWGGGNVGQLGNGLHTDSLSPVSVTGIADSVAISASFETTCVLRTTAQVSCWGRNVEGEMGNGATSMHEDSPVLAGAGTSGTPISGVSQVGVGDRHVCVVVDGARSVQCWGDDTFGQLGRGSTSATPSAVPMPVMEAGGVTTAVISSISAGQTHTCVRRDGGGIKCWGGNANGELGDGTTSSTYQWVSVSLGMLSAYGVVSGATHTCTRVATGHVLCWGSNSHGELGDTTIVPHDVPMAIVDP